MKRLLAKKKFEKVVFYILFLTYWKICHSRVFLCLVELSLLDLDCLYIAAANPHRRRIGGEGGSWGGDQVLWKPSGVGSQVAGLVKISDGSWGC